MNHFFNSCGMLYRCNNSFPTRATPIQKTFVATRIAGYTMAYCFMVSLKKGRISRLPQSIHESTINEPPSICENLRFCFQPGLKKPGIRNFE